MSRVSNAAFRHSKRPSFGAQLCVVDATFVRALPVLDRLLLTGDGAPLHPSVIMRFLLLIAVLHVRPGASCGPVARTTPNVANTSANRARAEQRAKEESPERPERQPLVTWPPDDPFGTTPALPILPDLPTSPPPRLPSRLHTFPPSEPDEVIGNRKPLTSTSGLPRDCADIQHSGESAENGVYRIYRPSCLNPEKCGKDVSCDLVTDGGGWTIIQQRLDGTTDFFRDWIAYRNGFGNSRSFWIGNEYMYEVTTMLGQSYHLLVQVTDFDGRSKFAVYDKFAVSDEFSNYTLTLGKMFADPSSDVDNFLPNRNAPFGTYDYDTDEKASDTCGAIWRSGWWHDPLCRPSGDLNVPYEPSMNVSEPSKGIRWRDHFGSMRIRSVKMKIRPKSFNSQLVINFKTPTEPTLRLNFKTATDPTLQLNFRSLNNTGKKPNLGLALWRRYRL